MRLVYDLIGPIGHALAAGSAPVVAPLAVAILAFGSPNTAHGAQEPPALDRAEDPLDAAARRALDEAPARTRIGKIRGARFQSLIVFDDPDAGPHRLSFSASFPARSRLTLSRDRWRVERYQLGDVWFGLDRSNQRLDAEPRSVLLTGERLESARFDVAMRRALFFWPDAGALTGDGFTRTATVDDIGVLIATLDRESGRPTRLAAFGRDGSAQAEFREITWQQAEGRWWPAQLELHVGGRRVWRETVDRIEDRWNFIDTWFLPVDRSRGIVGQPNDARLRMVPREPAWAKDYPIASTPDLSAWRLAAQQSLSVAQTELEELGLEASRRVAILLGAEGRATALQVLVTRPQDGEGRLEELAGWHPRDASLTWQFAAGSERPGAVAFEAVTSAATASGTSLGQATVEIDLEQPGGTFVVQAFRVSEGGTPRSDQTP